PTRTATSQHGSNPTLFLKYIFFVAVDQHGRVECRNVQPAASAYPCSCKRWRVACGVQSEPTDTTVIHSSTTESKTRLASFTKFDIPLPSFLSVPTVQF